MRSRRLAVVLMNLGGPDSVRSVGPFLRNLFNDPAIIAGPALFRRLMAAAIATARGRSARRNYARIGGASPLLAETQAQAKALEVELTRRLDGAEVGVFTAMRYWRPYTEEIAGLVADFAPDDVVLTPLYPQYSTTTTASSLAAWRCAYTGGGSTRVICCWPVAAGLVQAHVDLILTTWTGAGRPSVRLLFSAHGLPLSVTRRGDPYPWQVEQTCAAITAALPGEWDWRVCYQSRVGPLPWLGPYTVDEIKLAAEAGQGVLIVPVAFVSEHVETLGELDRDYRGLAERLGVKPFLRSPAPGAHPALISGLAHVIEGALARTADGPAGALCPGKYRGCFVAAPQGGRYVESSR